jgi:predicted ATP-dependent serine protease
MPKREKEYETVCAYCGATITFYDGEEEIECPECGEWNANPEIELETDDDEKQTPKRAQAQE